MNDESDNFEALRKLIALKRYEQPPPGYFNALPGRILIRLETVEPTFWEKLSQALVFRPAMAYALGLAFCGAFASGLVYTLQMHSEQTAMQRSPVEPWNVTQTPTLMASHELPTLHVRGYNGMLATNDATPRPSLFQGFEVHAAPVSYSFGN